MTKPMVIVSSFTTRHNKEKGYFEVVSKEDARCPYCGQALKYRNSRLRHVLDETRDKTACLLRRLWCDGCRHLHTEIPDFIQPHRHYGSDVIQDVLDGGGQACAADDSTIRRWRGEFGEAKADIEQRLRSAYARETDSHAPLAAGANTLGGIMKAERRWLSFVMGLLICHGHRPCSRFAFCPRPLPDKVANIGMPETKGGKIDDKTKEDTG